MSLLSKRLMRLRGSVRVSVLVSLLVGILVPAFLWAGAPAWWATRGVVTPGATPDDYAAVNQGQVKHIAKQGYEEMKAKLPGGAGSSLDAVWATPAASTDDFRAINLGQLKAVAEPFYARLQALGYTGQPLAAGKTRPWSGTGADDFALANIGQVKNLFSFDLTGFAQSETYLIILGGDQQTGPSGQVLPQALSVRVVDAQGLPVSNTTVSFSISGGAGALSAMPTSGALTPLTVTTGIAGQAVVYLKPQGVAGATTLTLASLPAQTAAQGLKFTAYVGGAVVSTPGSATPPKATTPGTPAPGGTPLVDPSRARVFDPSAAQSAEANIAIVVEGQDDPDPANIDCQNISLSCVVVSGDADSYIMEKREDGATWELLQSQVALGVVTHETGLLAGRLYEYRAKMIRNNQLVGVTPVRYYTVPQLKSVVGEEHYVFQDLLRDLFSEGSRPFSYYSLPNNYLRGYGCSSSKWIGSDLNLIFWGHSQRDNYTLVFYPSVQGSGPFYVRDYFSYGGDARIFDGYWTPLVGDSRSVVTTLDPADTGAVFADWVAEKYAEMVSGWYAWDVSVGRSWVTYSPYYITTPNGDILLPFSLWRSGLKWDGVSTLSISLSESITLNWNHDEAIEVESTTSNNGTITTAKLTSGSQVAKPLYGSASVTIKPKPGYTGSSAGLQLSISAEHASTVIRTEEADSSPGVNIPASEPPVPSTARSPSTARRSPTKSPSRPPKATSRRRKPSSMRSP